MKKIAAFILPIAAVSMQMHASTCALCEKVNEYNREHPNPYVYYEDYLDAQNPGAAKPQNTQSSPANAQQQGRGNEVGVVAPPPNPNNNPFENTNQQNAQPPLNAKNKPRVTNPNTRSTNVPNDRTTNRFRSNAGRVQPGQQQQDRQ